MLMAGLANSGIKLLFYGSFTLLALKLRLPVPKS
jgi:hypothetical protein